MGGALEEVKEIREIVERSVSQKDLLFTAKKMTIWGATTTIGFAVTHVMFKQAIAGRLNGLYIIPWWVLVIGVSLYLSSRVEPPSVVSYFGRIAKRFWMIYFAVLPLVIGELIALGKPMYIGAFISILVGAWISLGGILLGCRTTVALGLIYSYSSIAMFLYWQYQFLIYALLHFSILFLLGGVISLKRLEKGEE